MGPQSISTASRISRPPTTVPDESSGDQAAANEATLAPRLQPSDPKTSDRLIASDALARQRFLGNPEPDSAHELPVAPDAAATEAVADLPETTIGDDRSLISSFSWLPGGILDSIKDILEGIFNGSSNANTNPAVTTGLGEDVDAIINESPLISRDIQQLQNEGYTIEYGEAGGGTFINRTEQRIVIDPNRTDPAGVSQALAHEIGHAVYEPTFVGVDGLTREEFVDLNTRESLRDEANAILYQLEVRNEILAAGGEDIGVSGAQSAEYIRIAESGLLDEPGGRAQAVEQIADLFAEGESPSTNPSINYQQYYSEAWGRNYDAQT